MSTLTTHQEMEQLDFAGCEELVLWVKRTLNRRSDYFEEPTHAGMCHMMRVLRHHREQLQPYSDYYLAMAICYMAAAVTQYYMNSPADCPPPVLSESNLLVKDGHVGHYQQVNHFDLQLCDSETYAELEQIYADWYWLATSKRLQPNAA